MNIGVCTWIFGDAGLAQILRAVAEFGADGVELLADFSLKEAPSIRRNLVDEGLSVFSLTPIDADHDGQNVDLAHPDKTIRARSIDVYKGMIDIAAEVASPILACHGHVGRIAAIADESCEIKLLRDSVFQIAEYAESTGVRLAFELLNRYETHLIRNVEAGLDFASSMQPMNVGLLLDTYHMNIEEADPAKSISRAGDCLLLLHVADSNRRAPGRGHAPFPQVLDAVRDIGYLGPWIIECALLGAHPFAIREGSFAHTVEEAAGAVAYLRELDEP